MTTVEPFSLRFSWRRRGHPWVVDDDAVAGWSALFRSLQRFLSIFDGEFVLQIGDLPLEFDLDPDLSTVIESLPPILEGVASGEQAQRLIFFEQGTDVTLILIPRGRLLFVRFERGLSLGQRFERLPDQAGPVGRERFVREWVMFIDAVLAELVGLEPNLLRDPSYRAYTERLREIETLPT